MLLLGFIGQLNLTINSRQIMLLQKIIACVRGINFDYKKLNFDIHIIKKCLVLLLLSKFCCVLSKTSVFQLEFFFNLSQFPSLGILLTSKFIKHAGRLLFFILIKSQTKRLPI